MSTRGCVAIAMPEGKWVGVYNHSDSYPTGLGKELWDYLYQDGVALEGFAETLLHYDDWRNFLAGGVCPYCGKVGKGQPHDISGAVYGRLAIPDRYPTAAAMRAEYQQLPAWQGRDAEIEEMAKEAETIAKAKQETGFPDPEAQHHQHGDLSDKITSDDSDPLFIEWVYVVDVEKRTLEVLASHRGRGYKSLTNWKGEKYQEPQYVHFSVGVFSLDGSEPDWEAIEKRRR